METIFWIFIAIPFFLVILGLFIWSLIWVYGDAEKRGKPGWLVVIMVFFANWPVSLLIWLVFRPEMVAVEKHA
jgi:hypothetical protein